MNYLLNILGTCGTNSMIDTLTTEEVNLLLSLLNKHIKNISNELFKAYLFETDNNSLKEQLEVAKSLSSKLGFTVLGGDINE